MKNHEIKIDWLSDDHDSPYAKLIRLYLELYINII